MAFGGPVKTLEEASVAPSGALFWGPRLLQELQSKLAEERPEVPCDWETPKPRAPKGHINVRILVLGIYYAG